MSQSQPAVSVIMPILNEERHLADAVEQVFAQDYQGEIELILALGPSKDQTNQVAAALSRKYPKMILIENPSGKTPSALNLAIKVSNYPIIARLDGHALIEKDYLTRAIEILFSTQADNVGGIMDARGTTDFEVAVAKAMTSKFGVGNAPFHVGGEAGEALTVYLGVFKKEIFEKVGFFDESFIRAQDWEMNHRIRMSGGKIWFDPKLKVTYRPRPSLSSLAKQYFQYGQGRRRITQTHKGTVSLRYLAPPLTVIGLLIGTLLGIIGLTLGSPILTLGFLAPAVYFFAVLIAAGSGLKGLSVKSALYLPLVFVCMHICWGVGFLKRA
jgi:glycosyltransferase involved in cell wall biosynthesis